MPIEFFNHIWRGSQHFFRQSVTHLPLFPSQIHSSGPVVRPETEQEEVVFSTTAHTFNGPEHMDICSFYQEVRRKVIRKVSLVVLSFPPWSGHSHPYWLERSHSAEAIRQAIRSPVFPISFWRLIFL